MSMLTELMESFERHEIADSYPQVIHLPPQDMEALRDEMAQLPMYTWRGNGRFYLRGVEIRVAP